MKLLPPSGWADVARRSELDALELNIDLRFQAIPARAGAAIERVLNRTIRWAVGTMIALTGVTVTAVGLFTRLG